MAKVTYTVNDDSTQNNVGDAAVLTNSTKILGTLSSNAEYMAFRFTSVALAQGATIRKATLRLRCTSINTSGWTFAIAAEDVDNSAALAATTNDISGRTLTTAQTTSIRIHDLPDGDYDFDITAAVQEVINRAGWSSGNALTIILHSPDSSGGATISHVESADDPQIAIIHGGGVASATFGSNTGSWTNPTNANANDATNATADNSTNASHQFYNFSLAIPAGATIDDIVVFADCFSSSNSGRSQFTVELSKDGGTNWTTAKKTLQQNTIAGDHLVGGDVGGWSLSFTESDVENNTNFRIRFANDFSTSTNDGRLDYIEVRVYYTESGTAFSQACNEVVVLIDTRASNPKKSLTDAIALVETLAKSITKAAFAEAVIVADICLRLTAKQFTEIATLVDATAKQTGKAANEVIAIVDTYARTWTLSRVYGEVVTLADSAAKQARKTLAEAFTLVDSLATVFGKIFSETIALVDTQAKAITKAAFAEAIALTDATAKQAQKTFAEVLTLVDDLLATLGKTLSEAIALSDTLTKQARKTANEIITLVDSYARTWILSRTYAETIAIADVLAKESRKIFAEALALADSALKATNKTLTEAVAIFDSAAKHTQRAFAEAIALADDLLATFLKTLTELVSISDTIAKKTTHALNEALAITDSIAKVAVRTFNEVLTIADDVLAVFQKTLSEIITLADMTTKTASKALNEAIALADTAAKSAVKVIEETLTLVDSIITDYVAGGAKVLGEFVLYMLYGLTKTLKEKPRAFTLAATKETNVAKAPQRSFTVSSGGGNYTLKLNE